MAGVRYVPNRAGLGELLRSESMLAAMMQYAEKIQSVAEVTAPVDSGDYASKFRLVPSRRGGPNADRAQVTVENYSDHAFYVEYGAYGRPGRHTLFNAVMAVAGGPS